MTNEPGRMSRALRFAAVATVMTAGMWVQTSPSFAATNLYSSPGFDASYPQGSATGVPSGFGIIGVTHGRPFTSDSSASSLWNFTMQNSSPNGSLYFNTGYALAYGKVETSNCVTASAGYQVPGSGHQLSVLQQAWAIGCSEADYAVTLEPGIPSMWWADIETGNSWSKNTSINDATITGMVSELGIVAKGIPVGVYSTASMWNTIAGSSYANASIVADWGAGNATCPSSGFTLLSTGFPAPLWLEQTGTVVAGGATFDADTAC